MKSPKLYFYDVGLAGHLAGITEEGQWKTHPLRGAFFETMVVGDLVKKSLSAQLPSEWFFLASPSGLEVDVIELRGTEIHAYEIKSGATFKTEHLKNLLAWSELSGVRPENMRVLYAGEEALEHRGISIRPWNQVGT